jgi:hypothetical protein
MRSLLIKNATSFLLGNPGTFSARYAAPQPSWLASRGGGGSGTTTAGARLATCSAGAMAASGQDGSSTKPVIRGVVFDMDGTLTVWNPGVSERGSGLE